MPYGHEYSVVWPMSCCVFLVWLHCTPWFYWYFLISMGVHILRRYDEFVMCMCLIIASLQYKGCASVSREERKYIRLLLWFFISFAFIALYRWLLACAYLKVKDLKRRVSGKYTFFQSFRSCKYNLSTVTWLQPEKYEISKCFRKLNIYRLSLIAKFVFLRSTWYWDSGSAVSGSAGYLCSCVPPSSSNTGVTLFLRSLSKSTLSQKFKI